MYSRLRLDIGWWDLLAATLALPTAGQRDRRQRRIERLTSPRGEILCCLSVRSALDLYFQAIALPAGSEVMMSALNIPDMAKIVVSHGLRPVPIDLDPETLMPSPAALLRGASVRTRAVLVAHLFGCRSALDDIAALARQRGWLLLEDGAQAYTGRDTLDQTCADASFFSFGLIKTATALAGALVRVPDSAVLQRMRETQARQSPQSRGDFARRLGVAIAFKMLSWPALFGAFLAVWSKVVGDPERVLRHSARSFAGDDLMVRIRHRPCAPLLALLERRLRQSLAARLRARRQLALEILARLPSALLSPGRRATSHSHWVVPILTDDPVRVAGALRASGFDAAIGSSMTALEAPPDRPDLDPVNARRLLAALVYLPAYPALPARARDRMIDTLIAQVAQRKSEATIGIEARPHPARPNPG